MKNKIEMSALGKTWLLDLDGTIVKHNGYKIDGKDSLLPGAKTFMEQISCNDIIIFLTSRKRELKECTEKFLYENGIRYDYIIFDLPYGERILVNDNKPSGIKMAYSINLERDHFREIEIVINKNI